MHESNLDDPPVHGRGRIVARDVLASDHIENDVCSSTAGSGEFAGDEVVGSVIDPEIGPQQLAAARFLVGSGRRNDSRSEKPWRGEGDAGIKLMAIAAWH